MIPTVVGVQRNLRRNFEDLETWRTIQTIQTNKNEYLEESQRAEKISCHSDLIGKNIKNWYEKHTWIKYNNNVSRKKGGRGLASIEDSVDVAIREHEEYI